MKKINTSFILVVFLLFISCGKENDGAEIAPEPQVPSAWLSKASLPDGEQRLGAVGFPVNGMGYICTGTNFDKQLWQYNPAADLWTEKASLPAQAAERWFGSAFVIGDKAYILAGRTQNNVLLGDLWEYNTANDTWTQKASLPNGRQRWQAISFSINGKGYIGTGFAQNDGEAQDLWEYDPQTDTWAQKTSLPANQGRLGAVCFTLGNKAYIVGGQQGNLRLNDTWEYDPQIDSWTQKASLPEEGRKSLAMAFSLNGKGYLIGGLTGSALDTELTKDVWEYDAGANQWNKKDTHILALKRYGGITFVIGNDAYVCTGNNELNNPYKDLLKFNP